MSEKPEQYIGCGPFKDGQYYQHGVFCSGSPYHPRRPGNTCSCHRCDLFYRRLDIVRDGETVKRTLRIAACPTCHKRTEFPYTDEPVPREVFCQDCKEWAKVEEISWEGEDFAKLLPVVPR